MKRHPGRVFLAVATGIGILAGAALVPSFAKKTGKSPFPKTWLTCKSDAECAVVTGLCGAYDCVNRTSAKKVQDLNVKMEKDYGCGGERIDMLKPKVRCVANLCQCQAAPTPTPKSDDGW